MDITNTTEAEQYLKQNLVHAESLLFQGQIPIANDVSVQASREGSGYTAWNFILLPNGVLEHKAIPWLTSNGYIFITKPNGPEIQDWLSLAVKKDDFKSTSLQSMQYLGVESTGGSLNEIFSTDGHPARQARAEEYERPCPICKRNFKDSGRYSKAVCLTCIERKTDKEGRPVEFYEDSKSFYKDSGDFYLKSDGSFSDVCYIDNVLCSAIDGYMGGIVVSVV